ncbi:MAG: SCP2 sterol-binding domain-containing protein, partial [Chloroflexi bacterium]|nr:SCP2 sterol-binding domain-containing protein [Chloroflexota bacterium]
ADWLALINGETAPDELFLLGKLNIAGDFQLVMRLTGSMRIAPPNKFSSRKWRLDVQYFDTLTLPLGNI